MECNNVTNEHIVGNWCETMVNEDIRFMELLDWKLTKTKSVATQTLGLQPKQGLAKVRTKNEARESHFMLSRV
jgi:hypothetical protein